jgi:hypothetical protein
MALEHGSDASYKGFPARPLSGGVVDIAHDSNLTARIRVLEVKKADKLSGNDDTHQKDGEFPGTDFVSGKRR